MRLKVEEGRSSRDHEPRPSSLSKRWNEIQTRTNLALSKVMETKMSLQDWSTHFLAPFQDTMLPLYWQMSSTVSKAGFRTGLRQSSLSEMSSVLVTWISLLAVYISLFVFCPQGSWRVSDHLPVYNNLPGTEGWASNYPSVSASPIQL